MFEVGSNYNILGFIKNIVLESFILQHFFFSKKILKIFNLGLNGTLYNVFLTKPLRFDVFRPWK